MEGLRERGEGREVIMRERGGEGRDGQRARERAEGQRERGRERREGRRSSEGARTKGDRPRPYGVRKYSTNVCNRDIGPGTTPNTEH